MAVDSEAHESEDDDSSGAGRLRLDTFRDLPEASLGYLKRDTEQLNSIT